MSQKHPIVLDRYCVLTRIGHLIHREWVDTIHTDTDITKDEADRLKLLPINERHAALAWLRNYQPDQDDFYGETNE